MFSALILNSQHHPPPSLPKCTPLKPFSTCTSQEVTVCDNAHARKSYIVYASMRT